MGNIGDTITTDVPLVGSTGPAYATNINALLTEFKARLEARIPFSSLLNSGTLDLNGSAVLNAAYLTLVNEGVSPVASPANRLAAFDGDAWWVGPSGAVKLTDGANLNAAGIGGITGDYTGDPEQFRYDVSNTRYDAYADYPGASWAYVRARAFDIAASATSLFRARLAFGGSANVTYTLPTAAPASTSGLRMDSSGNITASNVVSHGDYVTTQGLQGAVTGTGTLTPSISGNTCRYALTATGVTHVPIAGLRAGNRIKSVAITFDGTGGSMAALLYITNTTVTSLSESNKAATLSSVVLSNADVWTYTLDTPYTLTDGQYLTVELTAGGSGCTFFALTVTYDTP